MWFLPLAYQDLLCKATATAAQEMILMNREA